MMNNPAAAMRMLITYAICIPVAIFIGYLLTNPLDYGTLGFLGFVLLLLITPLLIRFHYELLLFGLGAPIVLFFLFNRPPLAWAAVGLSLGIAIVERTLSSQRRFMSVRSITWPLLFILGVVILTMELTGGMGLHSMGSSGGGGGKYLQVFVCIAIYFALTSRPIPPQKRNLYIALFFLPGVLSLVSDLFPFLPSPLNYVNLLIPPSSTGSDLSFAQTRFGATATSTLVLANFMLVKYGLRGIFLDGRLWRGSVFLLLLVLTLAGGFRSMMIVIMGLLLLLFFLEGLQRTRLLPVALLAGVLSVLALATVANHLPYTFQRALSFLPLPWDAQVKLDAEGSSEWRYRIWRATWPKVPEHLLLGKGYNLTAEDFSMMGNGAFAGGAAAGMDASEEGLAISSDFHNGPLSTLMPFGLWGGIGTLWLMAACVWVLGRNFKYGPPELKTVNAFLLATCLVRCFSFFFIFGGFQEDLGQFAKLVGFGIALNGGVCGPAPQPMEVRHFKSLPQPQAA